MKLTLVEKAMRVETNRKSIPDLTDEQVALALAWARGDVTYKQAAVAVLGKNNKMTLYVMLARALRAAMQRGLIKEAPIV